MMGSSRLHTAVFSCPVNLKFGTCFREAYMHFVNRDRGIEEDRRGQGMRGEKNCRKREEAYFFHVL